MTGKRGEETDGRFPDGAPPPGDSRYRAFLVVSLIVLVWNTCATWRHLFLHDNSRKDTITGTLAAAAVAYPALPGTDCAFSGRSGPLNVRQNFLIGRKVDINRAGWKEISGLPGISDRVAGSIVETRSRIGGFRRPEDMLLAKGIKERRLKKILPFISGFNNN